MEVRGTGDAMGDEATRVARIEMPDGTPVWARISGAEELAVPSGELSYTDTGFTDRVEAQVESLQSVVTSVARSLAAPLRAVGPDEVSVEFGIELTAKAGKVVGLLADGEAKAGIKVTLTWNSGPPDLDRATDTARGRGNDTAGDTARGTGNDTAGDTARGTGNDTAAGAQPGRVGHPRRGASPGAPAQGSVRDAVAEDGA